MIKKNTFLAFSLTLIAVAIAAVWISQQNFVKGTVADDSQKPESSPTNSNLLTKVSALGRIEPHDGVIRVAGPPQAAVVIQELRVKEGDVVRKDQVIAVLLGIDIQRAEVARLEAELAYAEWELERNQSLFRRKTLSESDLRAFELRRDVARAALQRASAALALSSVRAPIDAQVLEIHAREGERVDVDGVVELGNTAAMYAVAEVYETDIGRIQIGQRAEIRGPALPRTLSGEVERIGFKIGKKDVLSTDPVADADARVVEVEIRLADPELAATFTNMRVDVVFEPANDQERESGP